MKEEVDLVEVAEVEADLVEGEVEMVEVVTGVEVAVVAKEEEEGATVGEGEVAETEGAMAEVVVGCMDRVL